MDFREWTALILMAHGTNAMNTISTKRAKQRAKKVAAGGSSHQKALDGIARAEGHAHWGAKIASETSRRTWPSVRRVDFLDRTWLELQGDDIPAIRNFLVEVIGGPLGGRTGTAMTRLLLEMWFDGPAGRADTFHALVEMSISDARIRDGEKVREHSAMQAVYLPSWQSTMVEMLRDACADTPGNAEAVHVLLGASASDIEIAVRHVETASRLIEADPIVAMTGGGVATLPDEIVVRLWLEIWGDDAPSWNALSVASRILTTEEPDRMSIAATDARLALGDDFRSIEPVAFASGMEVRRRSRIVDLLMKSTPYEENATLWRWQHGLDLLGEAGESVMGAWLRDSIVKVAEGRRPFSFNPLGSVDRDSARLATLALITLQSKDRLHGPEDPEPATVERAVDLIEDIVQVIVRTSRNIHEIAEGLSPSYPSVRRVLSLSWTQPGQFELFASLNGMDGDVVTRLRRSLADDDVRRVASRALIPFENPAMRMAAS